MSDVLVLGGASWNTMIHLNAFPAPRPAVAMAVESEELVPEGLPCT